MASTHIKLTYTDFESILGVIVRCAVDSMDRLSFDRALALKTTTHAQFAALRLIVIDDERGLSMIRAAQLRLESYFETLFCEFLVVPPVTDSVEGTPWPGASVAYLG